MILFEHGYSLDKLHFFKNIRCSLILCRAPFFLTIEYSTITIFAVFGTVIAAAFCALGIYFMGQVVRHMTAFFFLHLQYISAVPATISLVTPFADRFGSPHVPALLRYFWRRNVCGGRTLHNRPNNINVLIPIALQVDPLATLAIFKVMKVDPTTSAIASGEAVLNDAVSIVVFESVLSLFYTHSNSRIVDFGSVPIQFIIVFFGSIIIGVAGGLASAIITKYLPLKIGFFSSASEDVGPNFIYPGASIIDDGSSERFSPSSNESDPGDHDNRMYLEVGVAWSRLPRFLTEAHFAHRT
jgi:hypothetical protein